MRPPARSDAASASAQEPPEGMYNPGLLTSIVSIGKKNTRQETVLYILFFNCVYNLTCVWFQNDVDRVGTDLFF